MLNPDKTSSSAAQANAKNPIGDRAARDRALFDRIALRYARKDLYEPSRIARQARLRRTVDSAGHGSCADLLEVGCGAGFAADYLRGRYASYTGIDHSDELIAFASRLEMGPEVVFQSADFYQWQPDKTYDVIIAIGVLHHMPDISRAVSTMYDMLTPGGHLVVNEPQPANIVFHGLRKLRAMVDASYSSEQQELEESTLVGYFDQAGFEDVTTRAQGLLSTPFAEVPLRPRALILPLSTLACRVDAWLEDHFQRALKTVAWNIIVAGRRGAERHRSAQEYRSESTKAHEPAPGLPRRMHQEVSSGSWQ